jgi:hypothetical protein
MARCSGKFSAETKQRLIDAHKAGDATAHLRQPCDVCGLGVVAENKGGEWMPVNHDKRRAYNSGKRSSK